MGAQRTRKRHQNHALCNPRLFSRNALHEMQAAGASDKECRELTDKTITDISTVVTNNQKIIDELPKGQQCMDLGQAEVTKMTSLKKKADSHLVQCRTTLTTTQNFKVEFGSRTYSSLTVGKCDTFFSSTNYISAKASYNAAVKAEQIAVGSAKEASTNLQIAVTAAAKAKKECLCHTKKSHDKAFTERSAANRANEQAWDKAHRILCVLNGKQPCAVPKCPVLVASRLLPEAKC